MPRPKGSQRIAFGLQILEILAGSGEFLSVQYIAKSIGISSQYGEQLFRVLREAGIVQSIRGNKGGYRLSRFPSNLDLHRIVSCLSISGIGEPGEPTRMDVLFSFFEGLTLQDFLDRQAHLGDTSQRFQLSLVLEGYQVDN